MAAKRKKATCRLACLCRAVGGLLGFSDNVVLALRAAEEVPIFLGGLRNHERIFAFRTRFFHRWIPRGEIALGIGRATVEDLLPLGTFLGNLAFTSIARTIDTERDRFGRFAVRIGRAG